MHVTKIKWEPLVLHLRQGGVVPSINDGNKPWHCSIARAALT